MSGEQELAVGQINSMFSDMHFRAPKARDVAIHKLGLQNLNRHMESKSLRERFQTREQDYAKSAVQTIHQ